MTRHFLVQENEPVKFVEKMNQVSSDHNIFASQTHVTDVNGKIVYIAVMFGKD